MSMKQPSEIQAQTIRYYDEHAKEHADRTVSVDMHQAYEQILESVPRGGKILDAGCGSGRDTKFFADRGYQVTAIDASPGYADETFQRTGISVRVLTFQELDYESAFDGIWASASLLHVPRIQFVEVLNRLANALKRTGVMYVSVKEGTEERFDENNRYFNDMTEVTFRQQVSKTSSLTVVKLWLTKGRVEVNQTWVSAMLGLQQ